ncbi:MAG: hypothetical protein DWI22_06870 [Planctomycetota bacterium]|nr:MAG: hypothetical protein DWI22_06870 [Planctomycetota bacterium]
MLPYMASIINSNPAGIGAAVTGATGVGSSGVGATGIPPGAYINTGVTSAKPNIPIPYRATNDP